MGGHPAHIVLLCCDTFGVLPPVSKLSLEQALYYFIRWGVATPLWAAWIGACKRGSKQEAQQDCRRRYARAGLWSHPLLPPVHTPLTPRSGFTAKVAGTEQGVAQPEATFSPCYTSTSLVWHPVRMRRCCAPLGTAWPGVHVLHC